MWVDRMTLTVVVIAAGIPQQLPIKNLFVFVFNIDIDLGGLSWNSLTANGPLRDTFQHGVNKSDWGRICLLNG